MYAEPKHKEYLFGQFKATAVAGNDLMSSLLFTTGLTAYYAGERARARDRVCLPCLPVLAVCLTLAFLWRCVAGYYAPLCLFLVCLVLTMFRT